MPTEAEWEYAARAGTDTIYFFGDEAKQLGDYAWYNFNSRWQTQPVGQKLPNPWGLYDIYGNVWEWVEDWYEEKYYHRSPSIDPKGPGSGRYRVRRGGGWSEHTLFLGAAIRSQISPDDRYYSIGFRLVRRAP